MWKEKLTLFILFLTVILSGCQKEMEKTTDSLKLNMQEGDLPSLHPHDLIIYLRGISLSKTLFEGLTRINQTGKAELAGAESVSVSQDSLCYSFKLRKNHWSDGSPVTAHQYEHAWKEALSPSSSCSRADLLYMIKNANEAKRGQCSLDAVGVKALDSQTLQVDLAYPSPHFLELLAQPICAPLQHPIKKEIAAFNGPFSVAGWDRNARMILKPNPYFWNKDSVSIRQIEISMVQDLLTAYSLFEKGKIDWIGVPLCSLTSEQTAHLKKKGQLRTQPIDRAFWVFLNTRHPSLSSPAIRQALSMSIDRKAITEHILIGGRPLDKTLPSSILSVPAQKPIRENLSEARRLFLQGLNELNLTPETFPPLSIAYSPHANRKQLAEYLREIWSQAFGIKVNLEGQEWNVMRTNLSNGLFEICGAFEASYYRDPIELFERFTHLNSGNFSQWTHRHFGEKVFLAMKEKDASRRTELLGEAEQILVDQMPFIPICSDSFLFSHRPSLKGYTFDSLGAIDFSYSSLQ